MSPSTLSSSGWPKRTVIWLPSVICLVDSGRDDVVLTELDALGRRGRRRRCRRGRSPARSCPSRDSVTALFRAAVAVGGAGHRRARPRSRGRPSGSLRCAAGQAGEGAVSIAGHDSPNVVLPGPRVPARAARPAHRWAVSVRTLGWFARQPRSGPAAALVRSIPIPAISHKTVTMIPGDPNRRSPLMAGDVTSVSTLRRPAHRRPGSGYQAPPKAASVLASTAAHRARQVVAPDLGHRPHRQRDQVRRVGAAAVRHRGQERRVGLHQHPVEGRDRAAHRAAAAAFLNVTVPAKLR